MTTSTRNSIPEDIAKSVLLTFYKNFIAAGLIDPVGKSDSQLLAELARHVRRYARQEKLYGCTDYSDNLLTLAQSFRRKADYENSCLYYATWFEHWINGVIMVCISKSGLFTQANAKDLIRGASLAAKFTCLPQLIGLPPIRKTHCDAVLHIAELRNSYVHYKFTLTDIEEWANESEKWKRSLLRAAKSVRYLVEYKNRHIFRGLKHKLQFPGIKKGYEESPTRPRSVRRVPRRH